MACSFPRASSGAPPRRPIRSRGATPTTSGLTGAAARRIWHGERCGRACNWWVDAESDFDRARALGHNTHRLSLEWSRIEPQEGRFYSRAIARYRGLLEALRARGLKPAVTLHHFTDPLWLWDLGSWENGEAVDYFARFVERVVSDLRDVVDLWCTINEPVVLAVMGYLAGIHPPGKELLTRSPRCACCATCSSPTPPPTA